MSMGAIVCLGLVGLQLGAQIGAAIRACFRNPRMPAEPRCPPLSTHARRNYLDRKAEIERDARHRL